MWGRGRGTLQSLRESCDALLRTHTWSTVVYREPGGGGGRGDNVAPRIEHLPGPERESNLDLICCVCGQKIVRLRKWLRKQIIHTHLYPNCFLSPACGWRKRKEVQSELPPSDRPTPTAQHGTICFCLTLTQSITTRSLPIVRRSSSHWLMWGSFSISFHFLLRPFLFPPPPERGRERD